MSQGARSFLFVPANRVDRVDKALHSDADAVIVDLEDAVAPPGKHEARATLGTWTSTRPYLLRINAIGTPFHSDDIDALPTLEHLVGVVLPKVESPHEVRSLVRFLPPALELFTLIESAVGVLHAADIAMAGVTRMMFGSEDYLADVGAEPCRESFAFPRGALVVASAAAGIARPVDGPTLAFKDVAATQDHARDARAHGFSGKLCIHPSQVQAVNSVFSPTAAQRTWALRVVEESTRNGDGVFAVDGIMIDPPVLERAQRLLRRPGGAR